MRSFELIFEKTQNSVVKLQTDVINQVKKTDDEQLLDRIITVLNQTNLNQKITGTLERDTDTKGFSEKLAQIIINTPGSYKDKKNFIKGYPNGYVDIELMLSGKRVKFENLLTGEKFVRDVFNELRQITFSTSKGPGEFALAVLSPYIKITGSGDLEINGQLIEVKASAGKEVSSGGGRLGTPGLLNHQEVPRLLKKYLPNIDIAKTAPNGIGLKGIVQLGKTLPPNKRAAFGKALFSSIFGDESLASGVISEFASGNNITKEYIKANYEKYKKDSQFVGILLMNFALGELQYFSDNEVLLSNIYSPNVYILSKKHQSDGARQILSQVTLKPEPEPTIDITKIEGGKLTPEIVTAWSKRFLEKQGYLTSLSNIEAVSKIVTDMASSNKKTTSIQAAVKRRFPKVD